MLELTNNFLLLTLVMLVVLVSKTEADAFNRNIYDLTMKLKGFPYLEVLIITQHHGFPVIDRPSRSEYDILFGLNLCAHLITLLKKKAFSPNHLPEDQTVVLSRFSTQDFLKRGSGYFDRIEDVELTEEEMDMYLDLRPFAKHHLQCVETMSLAKALTLFREVGLRHLLVIPKKSNQSPVVGILKARFHARAHTGTASITCKGQVEEAKISGSSN